LNPKTRDNINQQDHIVEGDLTLGLPGVPPGRRAAVPGSAGARPGGVAVHFTNRQETPLPAARNEPRQNRRPAAPRETQASKTKRTPPPAPLPASRFVGAWKARAGKEVEHGKAGALLGCWSPCEGYKEVGRSGLTSRRGGWGREGGGGRGRAPRVELRRRR